MYRYFVLYDPRNRLFARRGRSFATTCSLNDAKHFTSQWSAENWKRCHSMFLGMIIKRIECY